MQYWESSIDRQIRKAMEAGEFSNLPGEGKPLDLGDDPNTPEHLQLAYKILRENDLAPDWIVQGKELEAKQGKWTDNLQKAYSSYKAALRDPVESARAEGKWRQAQQKLVEEALKLNKEIMTYNLKLPQGITHKALVNAQREIQRLTA